MAIQSKDWCRFTNTHNKKSIHYSSLYTNTNLFILFLLVNSSFHLVVSGKTGDDERIVRQEDFQALKAIKHELIDFKGILRSWNDSGYGACSGKWIGIKCVNGQVIAIQLPWKGLGGRISEKIGQLQSLRRLSLHDNFLGGTLPISLGFLPNLRGVFLFNNRLSGSIPPSFANCLALQNLDLSNNLLTGTIPTNLVNSTRIYRLNLSYNALSGSIPISFTRFASLTFLALQHNNLSGSIPNTWGLLESNYTYQLQSLVLDHNILSGNIPSSFSKLYNLQEISLTHNNIDGSIPNELGELSRLQILDLSNNAINGSFPISLTNLTSLVTLNLKNNHLYSQIPTTISKLQNLSVLNLKNNNFSGEIPKSLVNLSSLTSLDVSNNNLSGVVPTRLLDKFNSTSFVGNIQLCGYSPSTQCPTSSPPKQLGLPPSSQPSKTRKNNTHRTKDIILIAAGALLLVLLLLCCILLFCLFRKRSKSKEREAKISARANAKSVQAAGIDAETGDTGGKLVHFDGPFVFTADDLLCATAEIMGKSTYGTAYKATLEDGNQVAVKRLREKIAKGMKEFEAEVAVLGKIRHENILALRAYYLGPKGEKLLVFDYMSNGSLSSFLHGISY